jgi:hypothetical protein
MVRRIVGTLVEVGRGKIENKTIEDLLTSPPPNGSPSPIRIGGQGGEVSFNPAEYTAPPSGLFLEKVNY